jgi:hypothetical protein
MGQSDLLRLGLDCAAQEVIGMGRDEDDTDVEGLGMVVEKSETWVDWTAGSKLWSLSCVDVIVPKGRGAVTAGGK